MRVCLLSIAIALGACEGIENPKVADGGIAPPTDTMPDSPDVPADPSPGRELAPAAGLLTGGTWSVSVQLGSVVSQSNISGGSWSVRGGTPIQP